jgi:hypothetical protein
MKVKVERGGGRILSVCVCANFSFVLDGAAVKIKRLCFNGQKYYTLLVRDAVYLISFIGSWPQAQRMIDRALSFLPPRVYKYLCSIVSSCIA